MNMQTFTSCGTIVAAQLYVFSASPFKRNSGDNTSAAESERKSVVQIKATHSDLITPHLFILIELKESFLFLTLLIAFQFNAVIFVTVAGKRRCNNLAG